MGEQVITAGNGKRLALVVSAAIFIDMMFYAVISPILPALSHQLHMSKLSAGILTASYAGGMLVGALPGGMLAVRTGPRFTVCAGLLLLVISTVAFGWLDTAWSLDLARFVEGIAGACSWAGGVAWIVAATPVKRRGGVLGRTLAWGIGGSLFGPVIGAAASATGRRALFTLLGLSALALVAAVRRLPDETESSDQGVIDALGVLRRPEMLGGMWLMALPAVASGVINVLAPLQLHRFGAGAGVIGLTFLLASAAEASISSPVGRVSDRHGRLLPLRLGLLGVAAALACFTLPHTSLLLAALVILTYVVLGVFWAPAMALLADVSERHGINQAHAAALINLAWAGGQIVGSASGGAGAKALGDSFPTLIVAGACLLSFIAVSSIALGRTGPARPAASS